jgi:CheY-like chemotaxis protein
MDKCILYVEDDELQVELTKSCMKRGSYDFNVEFAGTGQEGIAAFNPKRHDMVVIDYNLPDMEAPDIAKSVLLKCDPFPIVFMSGAYLDAHLTVAQSLNVKACITKDDIRENLNQIAALL